VAETAIRHHEDKTRGNGMFGEIVDSPVTDGRTTTVSTLGEGWSSQPDLSEDRDVEKAHVKRRELFRRMSR